MRRVFDLNGTPGATGKPAQAASRKVAAMDRALGKGPLINDGPNKVRVGSAKIPAVATRAASASTWPNTATIITWSAFVDSPDVVWTSSTTATIATMGWYDLRALVAGSTTAIGTQTVAWFKNGVIIPGASHIHAAEAGRSVQAEAWEPYVRLNPGDTLAVYTHNDGGTPPTVNESRCTIRLVEELLGDKMLIKGTGSTIPYSGNADEVWLTLDATSATITGTGLVTVLGVTGLPVGRYKGHVWLKYQTTATGTGIDYAVAFSGTATGYCEARYATTGQLAATAAATGAGADAAQNVYVAQGQRTLGSLIGVGSVSVDLADTDTTVVIEFDLNVTVAGNVAFQLAAETAALVCTARAGSRLLLERLV